MSINKYIVILLLLLFGLNVSCNQVKKENSEMKIFTEYFLASKQNSEKQWDYTSDTVKVWFDEIKGEPNIRTKGEKNSGRWEDWDKEMQSTSQYDTIWYNKSENAIKGIFYENNDFYNLIGKPPTKTLRTYWFNSEKKIHEILIYWIPEENTTTSEHLKPIVTWATENDSAEISELYSNGKIIPSKENAVRWKQLLKKYHEAQNEN